MLNSAAGVILPPSENAPPIITISLKCPARPGSLALASAILVSGARQHNVTWPGGLAITRSTMASGANPAARDVTGSGRSYPSKPVLLCTSSAVTRGRNSGAAAPAYTGVSLLRASSKAFRAFFEVRCTGTFPATVVMASTSNSSGEASAVRKATASSGEGSVSMMMGRGMGSQHYCNWSLQLTQGLLSLRVTGMLFEKIQQDGAPLIAITLRAVNAREV